MRASVWNATFRALALDVARAQLEFALVLTAGRDLVDLESVRGPTRRAWNRLIGEQAVNVGIVILAANTAETILLNAAIHDKGAIAAVLALVPAAAGMGGLIWGFARRGSRRVWTSEEAWAAMESRTDRLGQWTLAGVCLVPLVVAFACVDAA